MAKPRKNQKLSDGAAKAILREWPTRTRALWSRFGEVGYWIRAQPKDDDAKAATPRLAVAGTEALKTQPDGMWCFIHTPQYADVVCVESCGSMQNLNDKRSRYAPSGHGVILKLPKAWLHEEIKMQKGRSRPRWSATRTLQEPDGDLNPVVRYLRVLYAVPDEVFAGLSHSLIADGHEYFTRQSALSCWTGPPMQKFLKRMAPASHFGP